MKRLIFLTFLMFSVTVCYGQTTRYWVGIGSDNWISNNWSDLSTGPADSLGPPGSTQIARFNGTTQGNCVVNISPTVEAIEINTAYGGIIDCGSNTITVNGSGNCSLEGGSITGTAGIANLNITSTGTVTFSGTNVGVICDVDAGTLYLNGSNFTQTLNVTHNTGTGTISSAGGNTFDGVTTITNASTGTCQFGTTNPDIFNDSVAFVNASSGTIQVAYNSAGNEFYGNIEVINDGDGVYFGQGAGAAITLNEGCNLSSTALTGDLMLRNISQLGSSTQNIALTGTGNLSVIQSTFEGPVNYTAPTLVVSGSTFQNTCSLTKSGTTNDSWDGGNAFWSTTTIGNSGSGNLILANVSGNDFQDDVVIEQVGNGDIFVAYNATSSFGGNISFDYPNGQISFAESTNGRVRMNGNSAQYISDLGVSQVPHFRSLQINNISGGVILNNEIEITELLDLVQGNIYTDIINVIEILDDAVVTSVSDASFVDGPVLKTGNDAFVFPIGNGSVYLPASISAPSGITSVFRAQYFNTNPASLYDDTQLGSGISHVSDCEYWLVDRLAGTDDVIVTLAFKPHTGACSGVTDPNTLEIVHWDGLLWETLGNGSTSGTSTNGTISTVSPVTSFSPFSFGNTTGVGTNPLTVDLLDWRADLMDHQVYLEWVTASETNNDYFIVQKGDGSGHFVDLEFIDGLGNANHNTLYSTFDKSPLEGWNYYRLIQVDSDGSREDHGICKIFVENGNDDISVYPNPSYGEVNISTTELFENSGFEILDQTGQLVFGGKLTGNSWKKNVDLSPGIYMVRISNSFATHTKRLIIK